MKKILSLLAALAFVAVAFGQATTASTTLGHAATLTWSAPAANTDGSAIASGTALTYNVYSEQLAAGASCPTSGAVSTSAAQSGVSATSWTAPAYTAAGVYCYDVTAVEAGNESGPSNIVSVTVASPTANPPAGLSVTVQ